MGFFFSSSETHLESSDELLRYGSVIIFVPLCKGKMLKVAQFSRKRGSGRENSSDAKTVCDSAAQELTKKQTLDKQRRACFPAAELAKTNKPLRRMMDGSV